jgi:hypothetical protein
MDYTRLNNIDNSQGGSDKIYIFPFVEYSQAVITVVDNYLTVFPSSNIYELKAFTISFDEEVSESYDQKLSFQLKKILPTDNFKELANSDWRIIIKDNNGYFRMLGLFTGLQGTFTKSTGANRSDFNGYNFSFDTKEVDSAPFLVDLSNFNAQDYLQEILQFNI